MVRLYNCLSPVKREFNQKFDHMALLVRLGDADFLTDVGMGNIHQLYSPIR